MNYIVFDLEWNQSPDGKKNRNEKLPFEIIEIGAVKVNSKKEITDSFHRLIRPQVYNRIHSSIHEVIHVDYMCNECGNCKSFCPYASAPYKDKFTLFASEADMADSTNDGFAVINPETKECKVRLLGQISDCKADDANDKLYEGLRRLICAVIDDYSYLIMK